jgi:hypothetical protein
MQLPQFINRFFSKPPGARRKRSTLQPMPIFLE